MRSPVLLLDRIVHEYRNILGDRIVGVYLHGSLAMGCFQANASDIDFLVIVREAPLRHELRLLVDVLIQLDAEAPAKGFEMSVLLESDLADIRCPMRFLLHYSNRYKERCSRDPLYFCGGFEDPDLPGHLVVVRARGRCLFGKSIDQVIKSVPMDAFLESVWQDLKSAREDISQEPVGSVLNLCRTLSFVREERVLSKREGGEWALDHVDKEYRPVISAALNAYVAPEKSFMTDAVLLEMFVDSALTEIGERVACV